MRGATCHSEEIKGDEGEKFPKELEEEQAEEEIEKNVEVCKRGKNARKSDGLLRRTDSGKGAREPFRRSGSSGSGGCEGWGEGC